VLEFRDNECPANDGSRRGDVYQRTLRRGESQSFPLCYANEPSGRNPAPGIPALRIPGGKGVITTWTVVGDCGEHSKPLNLDARTFYDRGEYQSGIILLQHPMGASHCAAETSSVASAATPEHDASSFQRRTLQPQGTTPTQATASASTPTEKNSPTTTLTSVNSRMSGAPTLTATIDTGGVVGRTVRVFAKDGAGFKCNFNLALTFTDGVTWNDHANVDITVGDTSVPIITRKYLKSVSKVGITSSKCSPG
jgi:hypothetical protein